MVHRLFFLFGLVGLTAVNPAPPTAAPDRGEGRLEKLTWLCGAWENKAGNVTTEEHWTPVAGGTILGINRTTSGNKTVAFEFLRIEERPEGIVYVAHPNARSPGTEFVLTYQDESEVVFENPEHDFPTLIRYVRKRDGSMTASIGGGESGEESVREFPYRRPAPIK